MIEIDLITDNADVRISQKIIPGLPRNPACAISKIHSVDPPFKKSAGGRGRPHRPPIIPRPL